MLKAIIYLFPKGRIKEERHSISPLPESANQNLTDYWMVEGPRAYRQSIISDKIGSSVFHHIHHSHWL